MKKEEIRFYTGFVRAVSYAVKQFRLYSDKHPITQQALKNLSQELTGFFDTKNKVTFGSMRKLLVVNGEIANEKETAAKDLAAELDRLGIEGVTFEKGLEIQEMTQFLQLMAARSKSLEEKGGFRKAFEANPLPHIRLAAGKYELVEEGQSVQDRTESDKKTAGGIQGGGDGGAPLGIADIIQKIRGGQDDKKNPPTLDCEKVVLQIEKNPEEVAQLAIENTKNPEMLEPVIRKVVHYLIEGLITYLVEQGKDISKALQRLAKELEKAIDRSLEGPEVERLKVKLPQIFEEATDDLRIQMMVRTVQKDPQDGKLFQKMTEKLFKDEEVRERLAPALKQELSEVGVSAERIEEAFGKIEDKAEKKKSRTTVDAKELEALRLKAKKWEAVEKKGGSVTVEMPVENVKGGVMVDPAELKDLREKVKRLSELEQKVGKVELEKKIVLDEKERVDSVIRNLAEGLLVVDKEGKVVIMNPAAERLLGVKKSEKIGKKVTEGLREEQMVAMTSGGNLRDSDAGVSKNVEVFSLNDETKRVLQASTAVIENEDGKTVGMVSVLSDVTRQKEVEELKTKFVANVSHELRTPLVAIQKSLSLMLSNELGPVNEEQKKFLDIASRNIERLSRLINDLLDISKIEAGALKLNVHPIEVKLLFFHITSSLENWAKDKHIQFKMDIEEGLIVDGDSDRVTQILTNLTGNAIKFTPDNGTITLDAKTVKGPAGEEIVEIGVADTGIGIEPEDQAKIFNKFVQVSLAQPAGVSSTGLGLTIAKEIVEMHHGKIWVESTPGKGSRFAFRIPKKFKKVEEKARALSA